MKRRSFFGKLFGLVAGIPTLLFPRTTEGKLTGPMTEWIDVNDRLPEPGKEPPFFKSRHVLVMSGNGFIKIGQLWDASGKDGKRDILSFGEGDGSLTCWGCMESLMIPHVTHWAELLIGPTEKENQR